MSVEHHELTLEFAIYGQGDGEVTAAFCSCGKSWDWTTVKQVANYFDRHVRAAMRKAAA